jgi:hypothetical protein
MGYVSRVTDYGWITWVRFPEQAGLYLSTTMYRLTLRPTQPSIQLVPGDEAPGVPGSECKKIST